MDRKKVKIDWKWLLSLPKSQRDMEIKKLAKQSRGDK
tara:strand:- start:19289 stop:19399 length:111 start_codon:yes stop_codon:yes gene_type:complete